MAYLIDTAFPIIKSMHSYYPLYKVTVGKQKKWQEWSQKYFAACSVGMLWFE